MDIDVCTMYLKTIFGWIAVGSIFGVVIVIVSECYIKLWKQPRENQNNVIIVNSTREPNLFCNTDYQVASYGQDPLFKHFKTKNKDHIILPLVALNKKKLIMYSPLLRKDRFHLKIAHKEEKYTILHEIKGSLCAFCHKKLFLYGFFAYEYYFCLDCIRNKIIPTFISERLFLTREILSSNAIHDQFECIIRLILSLCFDINQISKFNFTCMDSIDKKTNEYTLRKCKIFECSKCPVQTEFIRADAYQYLLSLDPTNTDLLKKIEEEEEDDEIIEEI